MRIDSHQHFWTYNLSRDSWMTDEMEAIRKDFHPSQLEKELRKCKIDGCVAVQADESLEETSYLLDLAAKFQFIKGVVGWVDLEAIDLEQKLEMFLNEHKLVGFRKILQTLPPEALDKSKFRRGIKLLGKYDFTYDILIYPNQLTAATRLVSDFPNQKFVLDHMAKPFIAKKELHPWKEQIELLAKLPNVNCKVSGLVTEAQWSSWKEEDFRVYLDTIVAAFGTNRLMFGSDWPVCLLAASYREVYTSIATYFEDFSKTEQAAIFGQNAVKFYDLKN